MNKRKGVLSETEHYNLIVNNACVIRIPVMLKLDSVWSSNHDTDSWVMSLVVIFDGLLAFSAIRTIDFWNIHSTKSRLLERDYNSRDVDAVVVLS